jgi:hypothetical protein
MAARNDIIEDLRRRTDDIHTQRLMADITYWRTRAEGLRIKAEFTEEPIARTTLLATATDYEKLAVTIEERLGQTVKGDQ